MAEIFNLVLARSDCLLVHQRGVEAFGRKPRDLFDLGGDWQRLEALRALLGFNYEGLYHNDDPGIYAIALSGFLVQ